MPVTADLQAALDRWAGRANADPKTGEVLFSVTRGIFSAEESAHYGDPDRQFFIASATKLFVTAILVQLRAEGLLDFDAPFAGYLPDGAAARLHVTRGVDATPRITVRQLMSHTSGLPDYFQDKRRDGSTVYAGMLDADSGWGLDDVIGWTRDEMAPPFAPGTPGKAHYSDTNYQLLGGIIEQQSGMTFGAAVAARIAGPLGLHRTYCFDRTTTDGYAGVAPFRYRGRPLHIPLAMASFGADGGIVSTLRDGQRFIRSFFDGTLIPFDVLRELQQQWRRIFFPLQYATGIMRYQLPALLAPGQPNPPLDGHSGASGAVMYVNQATGTSIVGTVNEVTRRSMPYRIMHRLLLAAEG